MPKFRAGRSFERERNCRVATFVCEEQLSMRYCLQLATFMAAQFVLSAQSPCSTTHLTIFDGNLGEFHEERTIDLQSGPNSIDWRSLVPQTLIRTLRVTAEDGIRVVRQEITYDGAEVRTQKSPVLHLVLQNTSSHGPHKVQIDYLAPGLSWKSDYAMLLDASDPSSAPKEMRLDGWFTIQNDTGADICAAAVDLVAGEVQLLLPGAATPRSFTANSQAVSGNAFGAQDASAQMASVSVFSRIQLGRNIVLAANTVIGRFPFFQQLKLPVEELDIFENEATAQTFGRGGFTLAPRGLEVRLASRNRFKSPLDRKSVV